MLLPSLPNGTTTGWSGGAKGLRHFAFGATMVLVCTAPLAAQTPQTVSGSAPQPGSRWEIDGGAGAGGSGGGTLSSTLATVNDGTSFTTPGSFAQLDRSVSSWWFGFPNSGSAFLMPTIQSLLPAVQSPTVSTRTRHWAKTLREPAKGFWRLSAASGGLVPRSRVVVDAERCP